MKTFSFFAAKFLFFSYVLFCVLGCSKEDDSTQAINFLTGGNEKTWKYASYNYIGNTPSLDSAYIHLRITFSSSNKFAKFYDNTGVVLNTGNWKIKNNGRNFYTNTLTGPSSINPLCPKENNRIDYEIKELTENKFHIVSTSECDNEEIVMVPAN